MPLQRGLDVPPITHLISTAVGNRSSCVAVNSWAIIHLWASQMSADLLGNVPELFWWNINNINILLILIEQIFVQT